MKSLFACPSNLEIYCGCNMVDLIQVGFFVYLLIFFL